MLRLVAFVNSVQYNKSRYLQIPSTGDRANFLSLKLNETLCVSECVIHLIASFLRSLGLFQSVSTCTSCPRLTWTSTGNVRCRSPMRTSTCGTSTTPGSNWSCGLSAPCADTDETPPGSLLNLEGMCVCVCVTTLACIVCVRERENVIKLQQSNFGDPQHPRISTFAAEPFRHKYDRCLSACVCLFVCVSSLSVRVCLREKEALQAMCLSFVCLRACASLNRRVTTMCVFLSVSLLVCVFLAQDV